MLFGITIVVVCSLVFFFGFRLQMKGKELPALALLLLGGLILRVFIASDPVLHPWDERYHALVAKNLMSDFLKPVLYKTPLLPYDYTNWTENHIWLHKQPLSLWLISLSLKLFGTNAFAVRIPSIIFSTLGILLIYDLTRRLYDARTAYIAAFLFAINGLILELTGGRTATDHPDVHFLFYTLLGAWGIVKYHQTGKTGYCLLIGAALGAAILTKWLSALLLVPLWLVLAYYGNSGSAPTRKQIGSLLVHLVLIIFTATAIALPWQLYIMHRFPAEAAWEYAYNSRHFNEALENHSGGFFYHFDKLRIIYGELIYLPVAIFTYKVVKRQYHQRGWFLFIWFWLPFLFFSIAKTKMPAYTLIASPAIFIITALSFREWMDYASQHRKWKPLLIAASIALIALPVRYSLERLKPFSQPDVPERLKREIAAARALERGTVLLNAQYPVECMFYGNVTAAYPALHDTLDSGIKRSNKVFVLE